MKFTSEDLMKAMGLKVGDRIRASMKMLTAIFEVRNDFTLLRLDDMSITNANKNYSLWNLLGAEYEIIPQPKRIGDLKCSELSCANCPLRVLSHCGKIKDEKDTLYKCLGCWDNEYPNFDQEFYDILKARLDKKLEE